MNKIYHVSYAIAEGDRVFNGNFTVYAKSRVDARRQSIKSLRGSFTIVDIMMGFIHIHEERAV